MPGGTLASSWIDNGTLVSPSFSQRVSERENRLPFFFSLRSPKLCRGPIHGVHEILSSCWSHSFLTRESVERRETERRRETDQSMNDQLREKVGIKKLSPSHVGFLSFFLSSLPERSFELNGRAVGTFDGSLIHQFKRRLVVVPANFPATLYSTRHLSFEFVEIFD